MAVTDYTQRETWQPAMDLADVVCTVTRACPDEGASGQTGRSVGGLVGAVVPPAEQP